LPLKVHLLSFLKEIGLLDAVPESPPGKGKLLMRGVCCLHDDADNPNGFLLYADGFACTTRQCHKQTQFGCNLEGLIRHLVYRTTKEVMAWRPAWAFARKHVDELKALVSEVQVRPAKNRDQIKRPSWTKAELLACLSIPSAYYLKRGFRRETLEHFCVGDTLSKLPDGRNLPRWAVVPVLDIGDRVLGYTARNHRYGDGVQKVRWLHKFSKGQTLYNEHRARRAGREPLIICEGPGEVFRFYEAGYNGAVATCGGALTESQYFASFLWLGCERRPVCIAADADERGEAFAKDTKRLVKGVCRDEPIIIRPPAGRKDFGETRPEEIRTIVAGCC
jgi:hypothetical protein